jgi:hypothetical protein
MRDPMRDTMSFDTMRIAMGIAIRETKLDTIRPVSPCLFPVTSFRFLQKINRMP